MNYDLAIMALEGLGRTPVALEVSGNRVIIEGSSAGFKELARLCLLLGSAGVAEGEQVELNAPAHVTSGSPSLHLRLRNAPEARRQAGE